MGKILWCLSFAVCPLALAAQIPAGWKVVKSPASLTRTSPTDKGGGGLCQMAVPVDWVVDTEADRTFVLASHLKSQDGKVATSIENVEPGQTLARFKDVALKFEKDAKLLEDSSKRVWLSYNRSGIGMWDVLVAGNPVCAARLIIKDKSMEYTAKKVAATIGSTK